MIAFDRHMVAVEEQASATISTPFFQELVLNRIRLLSRLRIAWLRKIWSEVTDNATATFNAHTEVDNLLFDLDIPSEEKKWIARSTSLKEVRKELRETEERLEKEKTSRLAKLIEIFNLNKVETDILQACLSISIDPNLARVFAYLQDNSGRGYVTETLVARLFSHGKCLLLDASSPLRIWGIIKETGTSPGEPVRFECDPFIRNWILGLDGIDEALNSFTTLQSWKEPLLNWPVKKAIDSIKRVLNDNGQNRIRIFVAGAEGLGKRTYSALVCKKLGMSLLSVNSDRITESSWEEIYMRVNRQALLTHAAIVWHGTVIQERYWPHHIPSFEVQFISGEVDEFIKPADGVIDLRIELPVLSVEERHKLWQRFVPATANWKKSDMDEMITRHEATIGQIVSIGEKKVSEITEAYDALRADAGSRLGNLAQPLNSDFTWKDLVVPDSIKKGLEDFTFEATERIRFWEQPAAKRLFPQGKGLIALFTGSPGTGKTMAAQVIAASLKLDLFRIDLSSVVSKYIGESSKNIERILSRAKMMNIVLLFDEADSLFGKRTEIKDAHDRYANTETNYLLQAIEEYPGLIILASNKKANIDTGFMRRLRYVVDFSKPVPSHRHQLWYRIVAELADGKTAKELNNDLVRLAELIELTGAQIKLSVLSALFIARKQKESLSLPHLLSGIERELMKEGRGLGKQIHEAFNLK